MCRLSKDNCMQLAFYWINYTILYYTTTLDQPTLLDDLNLNPQPSSRLAQQHRLRLRLRPRLRRVEAEVEAGWGLAYLAGSYWMTSTGRWGRLRQVEAGWGRLRQVEAGWGLEFIYILTFTVNTSLYSNSWLYIKANLIVLSDLVSFKEEKLFDAIFNSWS